MSKKLLENIGAEHEANEIASRFMDSTDVVGDMSRAFGHDFSQVHIHTDESAAQRVEGTGADAFAQGNDIFFGRGVFQQSDPASRGLLAHELTHTMQQSGEGGVHESAPQGAMQGGLIDWFRKKFGKKKQPMNISSPISAQVDTSPEALAYQKAMRGATMDASQVQNRMVPASPGQLGDAASRQGLMDVFANGPAIQESNDSFARGDRSGALVKLQLRNTSSEEAKASKAYRGGLLDSYSQNVADYFHNLEGGGMDMRYALNNTQTGTIAGSPGSFVTGGRIDQIEADLLSMLGDYATSDQGVDYLKTITDAVQSADVFQGDRGNALSYAMSSFLTTAGGAYTSIAANPQNFEHGQEAGLAAREAMRTLLMLPTLSSQTDQYKQTFTPELQSLITQYEAIVQEIKRKMAG